MTDEFDSSVLIEYLNDSDVALNYVLNAESPSVTIPLVLFEVYLGEVHSAGQPDFQSVDAALEWLEIRPSDHPSLERVLDYRSG